MKKILSVLVGGSLILMTSLSFAVSKTDLSTQWVCTTNASSSEVDADKNADKQMSETAKSAADAFTFAAANCRDCTKITCKVKK